MNELVWIDFTDNESLMHDLSIEMLKEGHEQYLNAMGHIIIKNYKAEAAAMAVLLSVQQKEGERKGNKVINVDDIDDTAEMHDAESI